MYMYIQEPHMAWPKTQLATTQYNIRQDVSINCDRNMVLNIEVQAGMIKHVHVHVYLHVCVYTHQMHTCTCTCTYIER